MSKVESSRQLFPVYASSMALCSLIVFGTIVFSPSEPGNTVFLGLSLTRLILAAGFLCATAFFGALAYKAFKDRGWAETVLEQWFGEGRFSGWLAGIQLIPNRVMATGIVPFSASSRSSFMAPDSRTP